MASRRPGALPAMTTEALIGLLLQRIADLERRVASLEGAQGQTLPGDFRFDTVATGDDVAVAIVRASTGEQATITPPL